MKGYIQVYTGPGKGKTTAGIGLAVRAASSNLQVLFAQFIKYEDKGVKNLESKFSNIEYQNFGSHKFIDPSPDKGDIKLAQKGFETVQDKISTGQYDLVFLDEINIALHFDLISTNKVLNLIEQKPGELELILTGRYAKEEIIQAADLVTRMQSIKHYYNKGVGPRKGIEY